MLQEVLRESVETLLRVISGGLGLQQLEAGFRFEARDWSQAAAVRAPNPSHQTTRDQWPVTRPWPLSCVEINFHKETESSEASKVFIRRKKSTVHVDGHTGRLRERESRPRGSLNHFYGPFLPGFLWPIALFCLVLSPELVYLRVLPLCAPIS